jgi:hypothetical protein
MVNSYIQYSKISTWKLRLELVLSSSRTPGMFSQMYLGQKVIEGYSRLPLSLRVSYIQRDTCSRLPCPAGSGIQRSKAGCPVLQGLEYRGIQQASLSSRVWNTEEYSRLPCPAGSGMQRDTAGCPVQQGLEYRGVQQAALSCRVWNTEEYSRLPCPAGSGI